DMDPSWFFLFDCGFFDCFYSCSFFFCLFRLFVKQERDSVFEETEYQACMCSAPLEEWLG
ncbi:hypothetical protein OFB78_30375, partial [Escherichia coli]|nr:hypothetical protein [Escherichia coli]